MPATTRAIRFGSAFVVVGLVALCAFWLAPAPAGAATLTPCVATPPPTGPVTELDGTATIELKSAVKRKLRAGGVRMALGAPANNFTGRPSFPVTSVRYGEGTSRISLGGAFSLRGKKSKRLSFAGITATIRSKGDSVVTARFGSGTKKVFVIRGGKVTRDVASGELYLKNGRAILTGAAAKAIKKRLGLKSYRALKNGLTWGPVNLYSLYRVTTPPTDPVGEAPEEPPVKVRPEGADNVVSASIKWRVRESFIRYVNSGSGTTASDGATPDPAESIGGAPPLVYSFSFPFSSGWSVAANGPATINGSGSVGFRYCRNTINFTVSNPEIELDGDANSRMIFRVNGIEGTPFPDSRAVLVKLLPSFGTKAVNGNTTTITGIPGYIPAESTGVFAGFYPPFPGDPDDPGAESSRFGSVSISYTMP